MRPYSGREPLALTLSTCVSSKQLAELATKAPLTHILITPKFPLGSNCEIVGDYVAKYMMVHHFSHYYSERVEQVV
jgi:hypothetical protein